ncbi:MAG: T9SS type A sorting domain-containing protein [Flavobacteriales bacterium]
MKKGITFILALAAAGMATAQSASVVVKQIDNKGLVEGNTYRVYVKAPTMDHSIHAVFADGTNMLEIESTTPFYQNQFGNHTSTGINEAIAEIQPALNYDSYITIGASGDQNNNLWEAGIAADSFEDGNALRVEDGAWFVIPTEGQGAPRGEGKLVLVAQLTTAGEAHGVLNVQGWDADQNVWQAIGLEFSTKNAVLEGNTSGAGNTADNAAAITTEIQAADAFQVFPNPVTGNEINVQFNSAVDFTNGNLAVDVLDLSGKVVYSQEVAAGQVVAGNRLIINTDLASGVYSLNVRQESTINATQQLVVTK